MLRKLFVKCYFCDFKKEVFLRWGLGGKFGMWRVIFCKTWFLGFVRLDLVEGKECGI